MPEDLNALWCRCIAEELRRAGVAKAVLCPGSRNSPLLFALAHAFGDDAISHVDERSAAFVALGAAKRGRPALVCTTSGSAVANTLPALAEANAAGIPLIVIAADRPWEQHDCGAPQTMPQAGAFTAFLREEVALGEPIVDDNALRAVRSRVSRASQRSDGPVLINVPMREPLVGGPVIDATKLSPDARDGRGATRPFVVVGGTMATELPNSGSLSWDGRTVDGVDWLRPGMRGLIVAGPSPSCGQETWPRALAEATGFPLIADACSGARDGDSINLADALMAGPLGETKPDVILTYRGPPLARAVYEYIARQSCPVLALEWNGNRDFLHLTWATVPRMHMGIHDQIAAACAPGDAAWRAQWMDAEHHARTALDQALRDEPWGEVLAAHVAMRHPGFFTRETASSMPVRHANLHATGSISCNRGLSGIDGTLGTFIGGQLDTRPGPGLLLIGDLAFLHDLPALALSHVVRNGAIVILNNDGGGIFDFLPVSQHVQQADYQRWVRTPHGMDFRHAAAQFGLDYVCVKDRTALSTALDRAASGDRLLIIECDVRGTDTVARHRRLIELMAQTVSP